MEGLEAGRRHEIERILEETAAAPVFIQPNRLGVRDPIDIWNLTKDSSNLGLVKQVAGQFCRVFKTLTGITIAPYINLAIRKGSIKKQA